MIRLLLAEDQSLVREGLVALLSLEPDFQVVAAVGDGAQAVEQVRRHGCQELDAAVLDVRMPVLDGVSAVREIKRLCPKLPVMMLTTYDDDRYVQESLEAGAAAYLLKDIPAEQLASAIRLVAAGGSLIPAALARHWLAPDRSEPLTPRQAEVLRLVGQGLSNAEIAARLFLSEGTVKNYVSEIYARLGVRNRVEVALLGRRLAAGEYRAAGEDRPGEGDGKTPAGG